MSMLITFLTLVLVLNCVLLILLVLIQLPKKEAGAGLAFGGGATDALFGAGSGTALTKLTKYAGGSFLVLCILLGVMNAKNAREGSSRVRQSLAKRPAPVAAPAAAPATPANQFQPLSTASTNLLSSAIATNAPAAPAAATNAAPK